MNIEESKVIEAWQEFVADYSWSSDLSKVVYYRHATNEFGYCSEDDLDDEYTFVTTAYDLGHMEDPEDGGFEDIDWTHCGWSITQMIEDGLKRHKE